MILALEETKQSRRKQQAQNPVTQRTAELLARYAREENRDRRRMIENQIARLNQGLVKAVAQRCHENAPACLSLDDLSNIGFLGLLKAIDGYQAGRNCAFSSYAVPWIRGEILHYLRSYTPDQGIKIPRQSREKRARVLQGWRLRCQKGQVVSVVMVAESMGIPPAEWAQIEEETSRLHVLSLDSSSDDPLQLEAPETEPEDQERERVRGQLAWAIARVPNPQARHCLELFYAGWDAEAIAASRGETAATVEHYLQTGIQTLRKKLSVKTDENLSS